MADTVTITITEQLVDVAVNEGVSTFTELTDVPSSYVGQTLKILRVNAGETALEFTAPSSGGTWGSITGTLSNQTDLNTALGLKAPLASPALTGNPTAPTQSAGDNSTKIATTAYVDALSLTIGTGLTNTAGTLSANLATGKAGSQSVIGGTASGENLTLSSTAHATKGSIIFGASSYNESTNNLTFVLNSKASTFGGVWTSTADLDYGIGFGGTFTANASASQTLIGHKFNPTLVTSGATAIHVGLLLQPVLGGSTSSVLDVNPLSGGGGTTKYLVRFRDNGTDKFTLKTNGDIAHSGGATLTFGASTSFGISGPLLSISTASGSTDFTITNLSGGGLAYRFRSATSGVFTLNNATTDIITINATNRFLLAAGSSTIAQIRLTSGTILGTAAAGVMEYDGTNLFFTRTGTTRGTLIQSDAVNSVSPTAPDRTITVNIGGTLFYIHAKTTND